MTTATFNPATAHPATPAKPHSRTARKLWKTGAVAGVAASAATTGFAALARAADVSLTVGNQAIPLVGFAQLTFVGAIIGTVLAVALARWAAHARRAFVTTTVALTVLSIVPDVLADASTSTSIVLALTHVLAAAIVIPALASRLSD